MKSIAGIERPEKGRIVIDGVTLFDAGKKIFLKPQKRKVGYLFQNYALFPNMTVEQNIGIGFTGNKEDKQKMVEQLIHHSSWTDWKSFIRQSFPADSSRERHWHGLWHMNRM